MAQLSGDQLFLILNRTTDFKRHEVFLSSSMESALKDWTATTRISPIFPFDNAKFPSLAEKEKCSVFFFGPVDPSSLDLSGLNAFSTYGIYNLIITASTPEDKVRICTLLETLKTKPWEAWELSGNTIVDIAYSPALCEKNEPTPYILKKFEVAPELKSAVDEYRTLIAVIRAKCFKYLPNLVPDFDSFDASFVSKLTSADDHHITKLAWIVNINAALSRFSSQTFAGTSPIVETECHFWTHSLLGIGLASQALIKLRHHYDDAMAKSSLSLKLGKLKDVAVTDQKLIATNLSNNGWQLHRLQEISTDNVNAENAFMKLIVYFSGRDGFRSTNFTLSAPLEVITGCNTYAWTPLTLTHELSHVLTITLLGVLLKGLDTVRSQKRFAQLLTHGVELQSALEQAQQVLIYAYYYLERDRSDASPTDNLEVKYTDVLPLLQRHHGEMFELLTHVVDFQYFYQRDIKLYMTSIWASWDVIPNIQSRIDDYLLRTLTATLTHNLLVTDPLGMTIEVVINELQNISKEFPESQYISVALERLTAHKEEFKKQLAHRAWIAKLVIAFLYDPTCAANIARESPSAGRRYKDLRVLEFNEAPITNPLSFLVEYAKDKRPDPKKSLWMLHQLAFSSTSL